MARLSTCPTICGPPSSPIAWMASGQQAIIVRKSMPANDLKGFIAWLKEHPDQGLMGTSGIGAVGHIHGVNFQKVTGTRFRFVPYRGIAPTMQDLVAGQIDMMITSTTDVIPQARAGTIKVLAVDGRAPGGGAARSSHRRRGRIARFLHADVACALGAGGHAQGRDRQTQRRGGGGARRSGGATAACQHRPGYSAAREADARRLSALTTRPRSRSGGRSSRRRG